MEALRKKRSESKAGADVIDEGINKVKDAVRGAVSWIWGAN